MPADRTAARAAGLRTAGVAAVLLLALAGCSGGHASAGPTATVTATAAPTSAPASAPASAATPPGLVAVTAAGALVVLNPATGAPSATLVPGGVTGDEVSVSASGVVYFTEQHGCDQQVESVGLGGGTPTVIAAGSLPAISPDGTKLAFTTQPDLNNESCVPTSGDITAPFRLVVRTLATGAEVTYPMEPKSQDSGLPAPISHLSWASDSVHLAVSVASVEDNEGWNLVLLNTPVARYYLSGGPGLAYVMPTGQPTPQQSYLREGIYLPDGDLFISRACCGGVPVHNTSRLMWVVNTAGTLVRQVAVGFPDLDHISLSVTTDGHWLLYVAGGSLYVSQGGATPRQIGSHLAAAAWS